MAGTGLYPYTPANESYRESTLSGLCVLSASFRHAPCFGLQRRIWFSIHHNASIDYDHLFDSHC
jgi:hypothetical protein